MAGHLGLDDLCWIYSDANDLEQIENALATFRNTKGRPTDSHIGYGSPHQVDTAAANGDPLGEDEVRLTKRAHGWPEDAKFLGTARMDRRISRSNI